MRTYDKIFGFVFAMMAIFFVSGFFADTVLAGMVNINTASVAELDTLPSVGVATAEKIIAYRAINGPFVSIEDLRKVSGFGGEGKNFDKIKDFITVSGETSIDTTEDDDTNTTDNTDDSTNTNINTTNTGSVNSDTSTHYEAESLSSYTSPASSFSVSAGRDRVTYVGAPISFEAKSKIAGEVKSKKPSFKWSLGDGAFLTKENIVHTYKYPGEYHVVLNASLDGVDSVSRTKVKVLVPNITLATKTDGAVEIFNKGVNEINLYGFKLQSGNTARLLPSEGGQAYAFPLDTIVGAGKSVTFPAEYLKLATAEKVILLDANNKVLLENNNIFAHSTNKEISQVDLEKFVLEYQRILALNNTKVVTPPAVSNTVLGSTTEKYWSDKYEEDTKNYAVSDREEPVDVATSDVDISPKSPGFWSKIFHPVRTVRETFYQ